MPINMLFALKAMIESGRYKHPIIKKVTNNILFLYLLINTISQLLHK